jgi:uncharacterized protein YbjT (DUF2867 family)
VTRLVLVLGATGTTGSRVAHGLREAGAQVRTASRTAGQVDADGVRFEWQDPGSWGPALSGVDRVYLVAPTDGTDPYPAVRGFLTAAAGSGVRRVVLLSSSALPESASGLGALPGAVRQAVPEWAILRPSWFMSNMLASTPLAAGLRAGEVVTATGEGRVAFVDPVDIAAVAVRALLVERSFNDDLVLTGPATHSYADLCAIVGAATGRIIRHRSVSVDEMADHLIGHGLPAAYAPMLASLDEPISHGAEDRVTGTVARITGRAPTHLRQFVDRHLADLRRSAGSPIIVHSPRSA